MCVSVFLSLSVSVSVCESVRVSVSVSVSACVSVFSVCLCVYVLSMVLRVPICSVSGAAGRRGWALLLPSRVIRQRGAPCAVNSGKREVFHRGNRFGICRGKRSRMSGKSLVLMRRQSCLSCDVSHTNRFLYVVKRNWKLTVVYVILLFIILY